MSELNFSFFFVGYGELEVEVLLVLYFLEDCSLLYGSSVFVKDLDGIVVVVG